METPQPQAEHKCLQKLVGEWTMESECSMGPDQPPMKSTGTETTRSVGELWTMGEGLMPDGEPCRTFMTLGYDPAQKRFVGTFIGSMMTHMWIYNGSLNGNVLTLDTEGPDFSGSMGMVAYQDIIEFKSDDHRVLSSQLKDKDGNWQKFMTANYYRKK